MTQKMSAIKNQSGDAKKSFKEPIPDKTLRVMASSIFKHLQDEGCEAKDIIGVSTQLLSLVTHQIDSIDDQPN